MTAGGLQESIREALREFQAGRLAESQVLCHQALSRQPEHAGALHLLGLIASSRGEYQKAVALMQRSIAAAPRRAEYHNNLGEVYRRLGWLEEALDAFRYSISLKPAQVEAYVNLGRILREGGHCEQAIDALQRALENDPKAALAHYHLGGALIGSKRFAQAVGPLRRALELGLDHDEPINDLGVALLETGQTNEALGCFQKILARNPDRVETRTNLANAYLLRNDLDLAISTYESALKLRPGHPVVHGNLGHALLLKGDLGRGWGEYEWWRTAETPRFSRRCWDGSELTGKTILLHAEEGIGDTIQFVRYAPLVAQRGGKVIVECQQPIKKLLASAAGVSAVLAQGEKLGSFDVHLPLLSLPRVFGTTLETIPNSVPYLSAEAVADLRPAATSFKVGLVWAGRPEHPNDANRSMPLANLAPLAGIGDVTYYSLQTGLAARQQPPEGMELIDLSSSLTDFSITAAALANLDLLITVDTAVAHLAGALARPVWVLLPFAPDWRWMLGREDSPWYPTMRLFRQKTPGEWADPVVAVAEALRAMVG